MHDLLHDPLIGVRTRHGVARMHLPGLLAGLVSDVVVDYAGLRAHQADPWHVFLVQIAASVMARHPDLASPPADEEFWRAGLLDLADGRGSAWELVVEDVTRPAFMQHPLRSVDDLTRFKPREPKATTPDELDVLVTAKDHDVKMARIDTNDAESWVFALVTCQTISGYHGRGNYGSVRMNSGTGSRCVVTLVSDVRVGKRFADELDVLRGMRAKTIAGGLGFVTRGVVLTWLHPWQLKHPQWMLSELEPWFVEAVRALRLVVRSRGLVALSAATEVRQIGPATQDNGDVGDPWMPVNVENKKKGRSALTVPEAGWSPGLVSRLLFQQGFELTPLQVPRVSMVGNAWFMGSVLARDDKKTHGFHRFAVPVPANVRPRLFRQDDRDRLGRWSENLLADAREVESSLRGALKVLAEGSRDVDAVKRRPKAPDPATLRWAKAATAGFSRTWTDAFFPTLWRFVDESEAEVIAEWRRAIVDQARVVLRLAETRVPLPVGRRYRSLVGATGLFEGSLRKKGLIPETRTQVMEETP